jgi:hypothetical protein
MKKFISFVCIAGCAYLTYVWWDTGLTFVPWHADTPQVFVNTDANTPLALYVKGINGTQVAFSTTNQGATEVLESLTIKTRNGTVGSIALNPNGAPKRLVASGHVVEYSNWTLDTVDISVSYPDGSRTLHEAVPSPLAHSAPFFVRTAHAYGTLPSVDAVPIEYQGQTREDHLDGEYYFDVGGTAWNAVICGAGVLTDVIPNPVSTWAAVAGCGTLVARVAPTPVSIDGCTEADSIFDCAKKKISTALGVDVETLPYLRGTVLRESDSQQLQGVSVTIRDRVGRAHHEKTGPLGFGYTEEGIALKNGAYILTVEANGLQTRTFNVVASDNRVKIEDANTTDILLDQTDTSIPLQEIVVVLSEPSSSKENDDSNNILDSVGTLIEQAKHAVGSQEYSGYECYYRTKESMNEDPDCQPARSFYCQITGEYTLAEGTPSYCTNVCRARSDAPDKCLEGGVRESSITEEEFKEAHGLE